MRLVDQLQRILRASQFLIINYYDNNNYNNNDDDNNGGKQCGLVLARRQKLRSTKGQAKLGAPKYI